MLFHRELKDSSLEVIIKDVRALILRNAQGGEAVILLSSLLMPGSEKKFAALKTQMQNAMAGESIAEPFWMGALFHIRTGGKVIVGEVELEYLELDEFEKACKDLGPRFKRYFAPFPLPSVYRDTIMANYPKLGRNVDVTTIRDDLLMWKIISTDEMEEILLPIHTRTDRNFKFLEYLQRCSLEQFENFILILWERHFGALVNRILAKDPVPDWFDERYNRLIK